MKDKAKSNVLNLVGAALFIAAGILYSVSVSGGAEATVYPLTQTGQQHTQEDTSRESGASTVEGSISEGKAAELQTGEPVPKTVLNGEVIFERSGTAELIDINTADAGTLTNIPGIGPAKAEAIIEFRQANGPFASIEDIMLVPGIKRGTFDKIKAYIEAGRPR